MPGYDSLVTKLGLSRDHSSLTEKLYRQKGASNCLGGMNLFFGDMIYLLFALLMPFLFAIGVFIFIRSTKRQKDSLSEIRKDSHEK